MKTDEFGIPVIERDTAKDFLDELDETNERWGDDSWLFRGQNDLSWKLHPSAMRCCETVDSFAKNNANEWHDYAHPIREKIEWQDKADADFERHVQIALNM